MIKKVLVNTLSDLKNVSNHLINQETISFDTETYGLYPFHGDRPFSYIFSDKDTDYYIDLNPLTSELKKVDAIPEIARLFLDPERKIFGVNIIFDLCMAYVDGITTLKGRFIDAPALARVEYNQHMASRGDDGSMLSMDYLAKHYLGTKKDLTVKNYISHNKLWGTCHVTGDEKKPLYSEVPLEIMTLYGWSDGRTTYDLCKNIIRRINQKDIDYSPYRPTAVGKMIDIAKNEIALTSVVFEMKKYGFPIDEKYIERAIKAETALLSSRIGEIDRELGLGFKYGSSDKVAKMLLDRNVQVEFNTPTETMLKRGMKARIDIETLKHERTLLFAEPTLSKRQSKRIQTINKTIEKLKISHYKNMKGNPKADAKALNRYAEKYNIPVLNTIIATKKAEKKITTYYKNFLMLADPNKIIHCGLNQEVTVTGRFSSSAPNLQNLHKETWDGTDEQLLIRNSFIAPENSRLLFCDYSQQEMYVMLDQAEEMELIGKLISGEFEDFYLATAALVKEKSGIVITRSQAKAIALGLAYGQGKALLAKNLGVSMEKAAEIIAAFFMALPKLKKFKDNLQTYAKRFGRIHNPFGRVYYVESGYEYKALNAYIQGTSADITKTAMVNLERELRPYKTKLLLSVHDEVIFSLHNDDNEKEVVAIIEKCMTEAYPHKHIGLGVDFEISDNAWGRKRAYEYVN